MFSLNDAIALWSKQVDLTHKLWTYLQVVGAGAVTYAWNQRGNHGTIAIILGAFVLFALVNMVLVVSTQAEAYTTARLVRKNWPVDDTWETLSKSFSSWPWGIVLVAHVIIDAGVIVLIAIQF